MPRHTWGVEILAGVVFYRFENFVQNLSSICEDLQWVGRQRPECVLLTLMSMTTQVRLAASFDVAEGLVLIVIWYRPSFICSPLLYLLSCNPLILPWEVDGVW